VRRNAISMKPFIPRALFKTITNKYLFAFLLFSIWMIFLDEHNILFLRQNLNKLKKYRVESIYYKKKIEKEAQKLKELQDDSKNLEKYAREQFLMKKKDEDIFLIIEKE
jgi:cell division protein DivIC